MGDFINGIQFVTGPLTLIAFGFLVFLAFLYLIAKDCRGLDFLYKLIEHRVSKAHFYNLAVLSITRGFWSIILIFGVSLPTWIAGRWIEYLDDQTKATQQAASVAADKAKADEKAKAAEKAATQVKDAIKLVNELVFDVIPGRERKGEAVKRFLLNPAAPTWQTNVQPTLEKFTAIARC